MLIQKEDYELAKTIHSNIQLIIEGQKLTHPNLQRGFIRLANQNNELFSLNKEFNELKREQEEKCEKELWRKKKKSRHLSSFFPSQRNQSVFLSFFRI